MSLFSGKADQEAISRLEALSEADIVFHWPALSRLGFGTHQIRQILQRLEQVHIGADKIAQGLIHAEWELTIGKMRDKKGESVADPVSWVFTILAKQGYYPRPHGYVSPQEQAALDASEEKNKLAAVRQGYFEAAYTAWEAGLSEAERQAILTEQGHKFGPQHILLKHHFRVKVWQNTEDGDANTPLALSEGGDQDA